VPQNHIQHAKGVPPGRAGVKQFFTALRAAFPDIHNTIEDMLAEGDDVYYFGLLRFIGCNSDTHAIAALLGDELSLRSAFAAVDTGSPPQVLNLTIRFMRQAHAGAPPLDMARTLIRGVLSMPRLRSL
jgi:hypothetical protein